MTCSQGTPFNGFCFIDTKQQNTHMGAGLQPFLLRTSADNFPKGEFLRKPPQALEVESPLLSDYDKLPAAVFPAPSRKQKSLPDPALLPPH